MTDNIITVKKKNEIHHSLDAFSSFMQMVEDEFNLRATNTPGLYCKCSASELEKIAVSILQEIAPKTPFDKDDIKLISGFRFPDIIAARNFGVEVKSTNKDHWTSTGSSIIESTREKDVENIFMLFGKLGGTPAEFKCRPYGDCLYDIAVTHSPRYLINMNISQTETIFSKMNTTYDEFRNSSTAIETVREYYYKKAKQEGKLEMPWWFGNNDTIGNINVRLWSACTMNERKILKAKMIILFPEILDHQYANIALWLCTYYSIIIHNARDMMSASGQFKRIKDGAILPSPVPHIIGSILEAAPIIKELFNDNSFICNEFLFYREDIICRNQPYYNSWLADMDIRVNIMLKKYKSRIPFTEWFQEGIKLSK